ncbi:hypothetical protein P3L10_012307 [Capsicum annuum]
MPSFKKIVKKVYKAASKSVDFQNEAAEVSNQGLGLTLPFSPGGFTKMVDSTLAKYLCVSEIFHKSFIEVNEEGTEAAAVTASRFKLTGSARIIEKPIDFVADHPFLFLIRDESTGVVVIIGSLLNPLAG